LNKLIALQLSDEIKKYSKKEQVMITKETEKMGKFLGGIRTMRHLPQALVITDPIHEHNALMEARKLNIPVIAFANTNANPDLVDFLIPANSSSIKTV
jgi:small subunit ribosomal protein S2